MIGTLDSKWFKLKESMRKAFQSHYGRAKRHVCNFSFVFSSVLIYSQLPQIMDQAWLLRVWHAAFLVSFWAWTTPAWSLETPAETTYRNHCAEVGDNTWDAFAFVPEFKHSPRQSLVCLKAKHVRIHSGTWREVESSPFKFLLEGDGGAIPRLEAGWRSSPEPPLFPRKCVHPPPPHAPNWQILSNEVHNRKYFRNVSVCCCWGGEVIQSG